MTDAQHLTKNNGKRRLWAKPGSYVPEKKNATGVAWLVAHLNALGVATRQGTTEGVDVEISCTDGSWLLAQVCRDEDAPSAPSADMRILVSELTQGSSKRRRQIIHAITGMAGYGKPAVVERGNDKDSALDIDDNFDLVVLRHNEFRKVPNPNPEDLKAFEPTIRRAVNRLYDINMKRLLRYGYRREDLWTYFRVWTCNYLGLYRIHGDGAKDDSRKLYAHLCQRGAGFIEALTRKELSCTPDANSVSIGLFGRPYRETTSGMQLRGDEEPPDPQEALDEYEQEDSVPEQEEPTEISEEEVEARRAKASQLLKEKLADLGHDEMVNILTDVGESPFVHYDAQQEAKRRLRAHCKSCKLCSKSEEETAG